MASVRRKRGRTILTLESAEVGVLRSLVKQTDQLLASEIVANAEDSSDPLADLVGLSASVSLPQDPALARLLPDAYRGDDDESSERSAEFRRYTEDDLRTAKRSALAVIAGALPDPADDAADITVKDQQGESWLHGLNDIRLALGTRLDVSEDTADELETIEPGSPRFDGLMLYNWLTMLQDSLLNALPGD